MTERLLTMRISGGSSMFEAVCPELDISLSAETSKEARRGMLRLARAEVQGILDKTDDERRGIAEKVDIEVRRTGRISRVFKV